MLSHCLLAGYCCGNLAAPVVHAKKLRNLALEFSDFVCALLRHHCETSALLLCRSNVDLVAHQSAGLIGPMIIVREGQATADARPVDVSVEFVVMFYVSLIPQTGFRSSQHYTLDTLEPGIALWHSALHALTATCLSHMVTTQAWQPEK